MEEDNYKQSSKNSRFASSNIATNPNFRLLKLPTFNSKYNVYNFIKLFKLLINRVNDVTKASTLIYCLLPRETNIIIPTFLKTNITFEQVKSAIFHHFKSKKIIAMRKIEFMLILFKKEETYIEFMD